MHVLYVLCGIAVVLVLVAAGWSKWGRTQATAAGLREFGMPDALARRLAPVLPAAELGIAAMLLAPQLAWSGALLASLLMALASVFVSASLLAGKHPSCNCFGQVRAAPITWGTALRNALLLLAAGFLVVAGGGRLEHGLLVEAHGVLATLGAGALAWTLAALFAALFCWLLLNLVGQQGRLLLRIDNLEHRLDASGIPSADQMKPALVLRVGSVAPTFAATTLAGLPVDSQGLLREGRDLLMLFVSPDCAPCKDLLAALLAWRGQRHPRDRLVIVSSGGRAANLDKLDGLAGADALLQSGAEINELFGVVATPSALKIGGDGRVASALAIGQEQIMALAGAAAGLAAGELHVGAAAFQ